MKIIELKCPNCDSKLSTKNDKSIMYCEYCGTKIILDDEVKRSEHTQNINITKRKIDESRIAEANVEIEKEKTERSIFKGYFIFMIFWLLLMGGLSLWDSYGQKIEDFFLYRDVSEEDVIIMPGSSESYRFNDVNEVENELKEAGFNNISRVKDTFDNAFTNLISKKGEVIKVQIGGKNIDAGKKYRASDNIIIYYYDN